VFETINLLHTNIKCSIRLYSLSAQNGMLIACGHTFLHFTAGNSIFLKKTVGHFL